jgi:hypothetical protein
MVLFDDELSAKQIQNIEAELKIRILDCTSLILDIFAMRAQTANAKTLVPAEKASTVSVLDLYRVLTGNIWCQYTTQGNTTNLYNTLCAY